MAAAGMSTPLGGFLIGWDGEGLKWGARKLDGGERDGNCSAGGVLVLTGGIQVRLYKELGPAKAPYATPVMIEGGEIKWFDYCEENKGQEGACFLPVCDVARH